MTKINQPSAMPTRKLWAVIVAGAVMGGIQAGLTFVMPEAGITQLISDFEPVVYGGVMVISGWFASDNVNV